MGQQRHFDRVRGLVSGQSGVPQEEITLETRLVEDLGLDGDDGHELLEAFADEFGVDMSGMAPLNYFDDEPPMFYSTALIPAVARFSPRFAAYVRRSTRGRRSLTVRSLVASARAQRWLTPDAPRGDADLTRISMREGLILTGAVALPALIGLWRYGFGDASVSGAITTALIAFAIIWVLMTVKLLLALPWLERLEAAATHEERALTATD
jgi:acyl carrier protein